MNRRISTVIAVGLMLVSLVLGQKSPESKPLAPSIQPVTELADALAQRLSNDLHMKTAVGEPLKVGSVTLIPILMMDLSFGGGGLTVPDTSAAGATPNGFFMSGRVRPLGFVVISGKGTRFISAAKARAK